MDRETKCWIAPRLTEVEACALIAAIGRPHGTYGLRHSDRSQQWLSQRFDQHLVVLENLTEELDNCLDRGADAVSEIQFERGAAEVCSRALYHMLTDRRNHNDAVFISRLGIDRSRGNQLRTAINLEIAIAQHCTDHPIDLEAEHRIDEMLDAARAMRGARGARCEDLDLPSAPELNLMGDAYRILQGATKLRFASVAEAWAAFGAVVEPGVSIGR